VVVKHGVAVEKSSRQPRSLSESLSRTRMRTVSRAALSGDSMLSPVLLPQLRGPRVVDLETVDACNMRVELRRTL
jgi:hypothetical protein